MVASEASPRIGSERTVAAVPDARVVRAGLRAIAAALQTRRDLAGLLDDVVRSLETVLDGPRVEIALGGDVVRAQTTSVALRLDDGIVGSLVVFADADGVEPGALAALELLATPLAVALEHRLRDAPGDARHDARIDALCGIPNRLAFDERLAELAAHHARRGSPIVVALFDIDFFKAYNDAYGHLEGDRALRDVAAILAGPGDGERHFCARYGGEEFVMLFADTTLADATEVVRSILERLEAAGLEHAQSTLGRISASVGIAAAVVDRDDRDASDLLARADRALFRAKRLGRNRICSETFVSGGVAVARRAARRDGAPIVAGPTYGRENDVSRIGAALRHTRTVTLVGPPGIGKSRLLALFAQSPLARLERRTIFIESEILRAGAEPASALASAFDLPIESGDALAAVTEFLDERDALLVLDCDDVATDAVRRLCEHLVRRTANVSVVASAREPLGIAGERWIVVAPLDDAAALDYLAFRTGVERAICARLVPYFGGNPGIVERAAERIARVGHERFERRLIERGTPFASVAEFDAFPAGSARP